MDFVTALLLILQAGYAAAAPTPTTATPSSQPAESAQELKLTMYRAYDIPPVYSENYATRYLGLEAASKPRHVPPPHVYLVPAAPMYFPPVHRSYYRSYRSTLFAPAPFVRGNYFNPSPFVRTQRGAAPHRRH